MSVLSPRPRGIRKSWKRTIPGIYWALSLIGPYLARREDKPAEVQAFYDRRKRLRRVEIAWSDGMIVSKSFTLRGSIVRTSWVRQ